MTQKRVARMAVSLFMFVAMLFTYYPLEAGIYKWTDEHGHVQFSDRPVTGESTEVQVKEQSPTQVQDEQDQQDREEKTKRMLDVYKEDRAAKKEAALKKAQERKKRKKNCLLAKDRYAAHSRASGIYNYGKDGDRNYLNDAERSRHMQKLKAEVARWCN